MLTNCNLQNIQLGKLLFAAAVTDLTSILNSGSFMSSKEDSRLALYGRAIDIKSE